MEGQLRSIHKKRMNNSFQRYMGAGQTLYITTHWNIDSGNTNGSYKGILSINSLNAG